LDAKLVEKYPLVFKNRYGDPKETLMCWGFECGDGWYSLIDTLCSAMTSQYNQAKERYDYRVETGVGGILYGTRTVTQEDIDEAKEKMEEAAKYVPVAMQVKEKFGGLRFYVQSATDECHNYIDFAERMSYRICEDCGTADESVQTWHMGWHRTLCRKHAIENYGEDAIVSYLQQKDEVSDY
jgi:hypothetical protein